MVYAQPYHFSIATCGCEIFLKRKKISVFKNWKRSSEQIRIVRNYAKYDPSKFCEDLIGVLRIPIDTTYISVNDLWLRFHKHAPLITKKVRGNHSCAWITNAIKREIRQRDYELKKARKTNSYEDWASYRKTRSRVTCKIRSAKAKYHKNLIDENSHNTRSFWKTMKKIIPGDESKPVRTGPTS